MKKSMKVTKEELQVPKINNNIQINKKSNYFSLIKEFTNNKDIYLSQNEQEIKKKGNKNNQNFQENIYSKYSKKFGDYLETNKTKEIEFYGSSKFSNVSIETLIQEMSNYKETILKQIKENPKIYYNIQDLNIKSKKENDSIILTPIPYMKQKYMESKKSKKEYDVAGRTAVIMRTLEYTNKLKERKINNSHKNNRSINQLNNRNNISLNNNIDSDLNEINLALYFQNSVNIIENWWKYILFHRKLKEISELKKKKETNKKNIINDKNIDLKKNRNFKDIVKYNKDKNEDYIYNQIGKTKNNNNNELIDYSVYSNIIFSDDKDKKRTNKNETKIDNSEILNNKNSINNLGPRDAFLYSKKIPKNKVHDSISIKHKETNYYSKKIYSNRNDIYQMKCLKLIQKFVKLYLFNKRHRKNVLNVQKKNILSYIGHYISKEIIEVVNETNKIKMLQNKILQYLYFKKAKKEKNKISNLIYSKLINNNFIYKSSKFKYSNFAKLYKKYYLKSKFNIWKFRYTNIFEIKNFIKKHNHKMKNKLLRFSYGFLLLKNILYSQIFMELKKYNIYSKINIFKFLIVKLIRSKYFYLIFQNAMINTSSLGINDEVEDDKMNNIYENENENEDSLKNDDIIISSIKESDQLTHKIKITDLEIESDNQSGQNIESNKINDQCSNSFHEDKIKNYNNTDLNYSDEIENDDEKIIDKNKKYKGNYKKLESEDDLDLPLNNQISMRVSIITDDDKGSERKKSEQNSDDEKCSNNFSSDSNNEEDVKSKKDENVSLEDNENEGNNCHETNKKKAKRFYITKHKSEESKIKIRDVFASNILPI